MRTVLTQTLAASCLLLILLLSASAQTPANEHNCPSTTAIPPYVGSGSNMFSPNQNLCLPQLAPTPTGLSPLAFVVQGSEPGDRVDAQGSIYVVSIRGVPGGLDFWRWYPALDGGPNKNNTLPFRYEGQPDNCGIFSFENGGCANNTGSATNLGVAPGGGDADIAVTLPNPLSNTPTIPLTSLTIAPGVTATQSVDRGNSFFTPPNVAAALIPADDRMWNDAIDTSTVYLAYHDVSTFNIDVQRSNDGGLTYVSGVGETIDAQTMPAVTTAAGSANIAGQIHIDHSSCSSRGNLYVVFVGPDSAAENVTGAPLRTVYVGVSTDAKLLGPSFTFTDYKAYTSPLGSLGAINGTDQIFPALAVDGFGYVYAVWSDNSNIFFSSSSDLGKTWRTTPIRVNQGNTVGKSNLFPWIAADANGHVVVSWVGANLSGNSNDPTAMEQTCSDGTVSCWAHWNVYVAESVNANAAAASFTQYTASDHVIHYGTVSTGGFGGSANRNLGDFFQAALDPQHRANISFADDHLASPLCSTQTPGHCSNTDPQAFRVGTPYFTYQLKTNPHIVTTGTCAGS
jgi:hypothetical protein